MCCPLERAQGVFIPQTVAIEQRGQVEIYHVRGVIDRTPNTLTDRLLRFFQNLELVEKIAEVIDESFHLVGSLFQRYSSVLIYQTARNLHHGAHDFEHFLHATCFFGDLLRLMTGKYFESDDKEKKTFTYLRNAGRINHTFAHFLGTADFFADLKIYPFGRLEKWFKYASVLSAIGYLCWTAALVWKRKQDHLKSDLGIHLGGFLFESISLAKTIKSLATYASTINKIAAVFGVIHASCVAQRLMTPDREVVQGQFVMPAIEEEEEHEDHDHHGHADHGHLHFQPVMVE